MIFLSYAREDDARAEKVFALVSRPDRPVFYDRHSIVAGMDWRYETEERLRECKLVLILCSAHSISKEGFVQREIRLALDRAEEMPDGRLFIIPVRFDGVRVPSKLAKYHWIDVVDDADLTDVQFFVDLAWDQVTGRRWAADELDADGPQYLERGLLRERVVILLEGKNLQGEQIFTYLKLPLWKLQELRSVMRAQQNFAPADFGVVVEQGKGAPSPELRERMSAEHNMVDVPRAAPRDDLPPPEIQMVYQTAFTEAYRSVLGADAPVPLVLLHLPIPDGSSALREGLRHGLAAARKVIGEQ